MTGEYVTAAKIAGSQKYIVIQNVSHEFKFTKYGLPVLENIHLDIARGEFVALLGPSGSGKSTLLKIIAGLLTPIAGKVIIDGTSIEGPTPRVGVTFQKPILLPWRTVKANLRLPAELAGTWNEKSKARADMLLNVSGLTSFDEVYPNQLSAGMQQMASFCMALVLDPDVLLMDEPFGSLDPITREYFCFQLQDVWSKLGKTVILG